MVQKVELQEMGGKHGYEVRTGSGGWTGCRMGKGCNEGGGSVGRRRDGGGCGRAGAPFLPHNSRR